MANSRTGADGSVTNGIGGSRMNAIDWIALVLLIVGGVNWALVGLFDYDLVAAILGSMTTGSRIVYILVGLAAVYAIYLMVKIAPKRGGP